MIKRVKISEEKIPAAMEINSIISSIPGWRSDSLSRLRALIRNTDSSIVEEVKWKKPSRPMGVPVWSSNGIICVGEALKNAVRLTFPKGAQIHDPHGLFNTRLESRTVRAIDFHQEDPMVDSDLIALIKQAIQLNAKKTGDG